MFKEIKTEDLEILEDCMRYHLEHCEEIVDGVKLIMEQWERDQYFADMILVRFELERRLKEVARQELELTVLRGGL